MPLDVAAIRQEFPIFKRKFHGKRLVFLDSAASSQKPRAVIGALMRVYTHSYTNVHRGLYALAEEATALYEEARAKIATFINAPEPAEVINVRNATEGINLVAYSWGETHIHAGDRIVVTEMEHHANLVPWQQLALRKGAELAYIPVNDAGQLDLAALPALLEDGRTKIVACSVMSNVLGTVPPVKQVAEMAHAAGALVVMDGAQAVPHRPVDVQALGADFMAFSGHKMCGPGVGVLWGRRELLEAMPPFLYGGDMIRTVKRDYAKWNEVPYKFEAGTPAIAEVVALGAAVDFLSAIGMDAVHAHEQEIVAYAMERLAELPRVHILGPGPAERGGVVAFWMDGIHPHDIASVLDEEGVCVRAGHHCAQPLHERFGLAASARASFYIYNDKDDVEALVKALHKVERILGK
ncbi:MAG TPA: cysteine desulfurase [Anaerolineae bacterium]|nr:cysteine desulfurase [Anaerolineae bacterium]HQK13949.1 cysteine desulfurase [Anaerolineae bacterium]